MIEEPPLLTVRRNFKRPSAALLARFRGLPTGLVADAQSGRGGFAGTMQPLKAGSHLVGPAITCWCGPADNLAALAALELARPGDVIVVAADNFAGTAVIGDRFAAMAVKRGIAGCIVDGMVRDREGILAAGLACWSRGLQPNSPYAKGPGEVGLPIVAGGVAVDAGDLVLADDEGVLVVPRATVARVADAVDQVKANEASMEAELAGGLDRFPFVSALLASERTRWVD